MKKTFSRTIGLTVLGGMLLPAFVMAQTAAVTTSANVTTPVANAAVDAKVSAAKVKADQEIDRRVAALTDVSARVQAMQKITDTFKQNLATSVQGQIAAFNGLKAKIDAGTDTETLKTDIQSITSSYRVYALFLPQARIAAMADREVTIASMMITLGTKLQTRITAAQSAGGNVAALTAALNDMGTKITDANTQAQAAVTASVALTPDGGDKTKMAANLATLKTARASLLAAQKDLQAARKDVDTIVLGLAKLNVSATATTSVQTQ